jgi:hypothetical protein
MILNKIFYLLTKFDQPENSNYNLLILTVLQNVTQIYYDFLYIYLIVDAMHQDTKYQ